MIAPLLALALTVSPSLSPSLSPGAAQDDPPAPRPERVRAAVEALERAFDAETTAQVASGIQAAADVAAPEIVALLADRGLEDERQAVARASLEALGRLRCDEALEELHAYLKREKKALHKREKQALFPALLQAIARHGAEESIPLLVDDLFRTPGKEIVRARVLGLGNIRARGSVEELMGFMRKVDRRKVQPHMTEFRLALMILTGVDHGTDQDRWVAWWNEHKKTFAVPEKAPLLPEALQNRWNRYWGLPREYARQKRRTERGGGDGGG